ncbi:helix-turn-helix domain-containing protein [Paenibacillus chartarius]|uniref:Helix-turn-helix domain-containing protein n=1 Tax=Paenibacillus chartarius TaxID=747481 RepID=A0ABV6DEH7_9BACL
MVYRLLIADDEALEREGLEFIVERMMPGMFQIMHAENGRLAIQRAEQFRPHIVLMDIKMPGIEGLEALRQMKEKQPELKMVLVTAYDFFSYAQQAVSLGVKEYLLKPAKRDQVVAVLQRLVRELEQEGERRDEELRREEKLLQLLPLAESELAVLLMSGGVVETELERIAELVELEAADGAAFAVLADAGADARRLALLLRRWANAARLRCLVSPVVGGHAAVFVLGGGASTGGAAADDGGGGFGGGRGAAAVSAGALQPEELAQRASAFLAEQLGVAVRAAAGPVQAGLDGLRRSYRAAAAGLGVSLGAAGEPVPPLGAEGRGGGDGGGSGAAVRAGGGTGGAGTAGAAGAAGAGAAEPTGHAAGAVERAKAWIAEHYREELSMEQAAEYVSLSPFYFSKLFKQHVGETFIDYVTRLRINRAKELIAGDPELSLKEICFEVGYHDPNYFSRVFKKVTGMSPTDFRADLQQR